MTLFTLHSHHHFQWNHSQKQANTGTNLRVSSSDCPICGYLFGAVAEPLLSIEHNFTRYHVVQQSETPSIDKAFFTPVLGRSPPLMA